MKKILFIHTGGTIMMEEDEQTGIVQPGVIHPLQLTLQAITDLAEIKTEELFHVPSPSMTPVMMLTLAEKIKERLNNEYFDGVVVTHGTDTLEETAYFLDLCLHVSVPVVVTGAMRSSNEIGADGLYNARSAAKVAMCDEARDKGVLVVLNDEIHTAKNVTKTHTSNVATFQSPQYGPIGMVTKRGVSFHHVPVQRDCYPVTAVNKQVILLKAYAGMDETIFQALAQMDVDGIVIEALGQGNLPPQTLPGLQSFLDKQVPIVLVSRCFNGVVQDVYGYSGGGKHLKELGMIFSNGLNGQKARIKLMILLGITNDLAHIQELFLR